MEKHEFIKASGAIQVANVSKNALTLQQMKTWNILLANAWHSLKKDEIHSIHLLDLMRLLGEKHNNWAALKNNFRALAGVTVEWNVMNKDKEMSWGVATLLSQAEIVNSTRLEYAYPPKIRDLLADPRIFARLSLLQQSVLKSKYSLILYEICTDYKGVKQTPFYPLEDFRRIMGIKDEEYPEFKRFSQRVIKAPIKEVNQKTPLEISVEYRRQSRRVTGLKFHIKEKDDFIFKGPAKAQMSLPLESSVDPLHAKSQEIPVEKERVPVFKELRKAGLREDDARTLLQQHSDEQIMSNLHYVLDRLQGSSKQKVKNPRAYLIMAIKDDYAKEDRDTANRQKIAKAKRLEQEKAREASAMLEYYSREYKAFNQYCSQHKPTIEAPTFEAWLYEEFRIKLEKKGDKDILVPPLLDRTIYDLLEEHAEILEFEAQDLPHDKIEKAKEEFKSLSAYQTYLLQKSHYAVFEHIFLCKLAEELPEYFRTPADPVLFAKDKRITLERLGSGCSSWNFRVLGS